MGAAAWGRAPRHRRCQRCCAPAGWGCRPGPSRRAGGRCRRGGGPCWTEAVHDETDGTAARRDRGVHPRSERLSLVDDAPPARFRGRPPGVRGTRRPVWSPRAGPAGTLGAGDGPMHRAFTIARDPRSWKAWSALAALVAILSAVLSGVAAAGGQQLPAFWVLWAVMAAAGLAALTVRAVAIARHAAGAMTW